MQKNTTQIMAALMLGLSEFGSHPAMKPIYRKTKPVQSESEKLERLEAAQLKRLRKNAKRINQKLCR
jgi:hypothetical protein